MISKIRAVYKEAGIVGLGWRGFSYVYKNAIRTILPVRGPVLYSGITVGFRKIGDSFLLKLYNPPSLNDIPGYEQGLVAALKANVREGDTVVVVGGGLGVTAIIAAIAVAEKGRVECFEGNLQSVNSILSAAAINGVAKRLTVRHAIVGKDIDVWGVLKSSIFINPSELPDCDVLELDCEGSELDILRDMVIQPRVIAVETHGFLGSSTSTVRNILECRGYRVIDLGWAEPRVLDECADRDIKVLVGTR
jgi:hypothetical protein